MFYFQKPKHKKHIGELAIFPTPDMKFKQQIFYFIVAGDLQKSTFSVNQNLDIVFLIRNILQLSIQSKKKKKYFLSEYDNKLKQRGKGRSSIISDDNNMPSTIYKCYTAEPFELFFVL